MKIHRFEQKQVSLVVDDHDVVGKSVIEHDSGAFLQHVGVETSRVEQFDPVGEDFVHRQPPMAPYRVLKAG